MSEQLPVCALCGQAPHRGGQTVYCATVACGMTGALVTADEWRRLMARPSLAPEHVASLRDMLNFCEQYTRDHPIPRAIRAALAALGEEWP